MKRVIPIASSVLLALIVSLTPAAARSAATAGTQAAPAAPVAISLFAQVGPTYQNVDAKNWFTQYVEKTFNVKLDWSTVAPADAVAKQQLLLESGNYPAVFYNGNFSQAQLLKFGQQGILIPLNKYLSQYAPNVLKAFGEFTGAKQAVTAPNGTIYAIPSLNYCLHCDFAGKLWINTRWMAKLHLSMPRTTAQFFQVLQAFKRMPGVKNPIPLSGATDGWNSDPTIFLMNAFTYLDGPIGGTAAPAFHVQIQQGKVAFAPIQPQYKQGLTYIHSLVTGGMLDSSTFTQKNTQLQAEVQQGRVGVFAEGVDSDVVNYGTRPGPGGSKSSDWVVVPPLTGPSGANYAAFYGQGPRIVPFAITNKATPAQIKAILTLVNWIYTLKGTTMMNFGPQGKNWSYAKSDQRGLCGGKGILNINWNAPTTQWGWSQLGPMYQSHVWRCGGPYTAIFSPTSEEEKYQTMTAQNYEGHQPKQVYPAAIWLSPTQTTSFATTQTTINSYVAQSTYDFILGRKDIASNWSSYVSGLQGLGLAQYLQTLQSANPKPVPTTEFCPSTPTTLPCHH